MRAMCLTVALAKLLVTNFGDLHSPEDAFSLFITDELLHQIARYHNAEGRQKAQAREQGYKDISVIELKGYLGVLIIGGTRNDNKTARNTAFLTLKHPSQETGSKQYTRISDLMIKLREQPEDMRAFLLPWRKCTTILQQGWGGTTPQAPL